MKTSLLTLLAAASMASAAGPRYVMYFDEWHFDPLPPKEVTAGINYVITAFANPANFTDAQPPAYKPFMSLDKIRALFDAGTKVCMAVGGWGMNEGFDIATVSDASRKQFAKNVASVATTLGYDCVEVDWEYPGGNGEDYKKNPNSGKVGAIETYPLLLKEIKAAISPMELSIAVPGKEVDMMAYTAEQMPKINATVDFVNVMTYDLMNRRDNVTNHHTSIKGSLAVIDMYLARGMPADKMNLGFAFYAKYFTTASDVTCDKPTGCKTALLEYANGTDAGLSGAATFEGSSYSGAFAQAVEKGKADEEEGGQWYWDSAAHVYWTFDTPEFIAKKFTDIVKAKGLGGVMAWSLGLDSLDWRHLKAMQRGVKCMSS
ncbi:chitinase 18-11 [Cordyceps fumosorosea ARSEF 2679]|uniref:chitinase n=1 Tax=Cordyceps fumosorosea (strain ARSEF 2679) TaxID=1081104 RepID=A0A168D626_CORFA|nr:chitinase 18-11 [Cordyceps fumosorosea ARSEF 2679]OAA72216.1 chitinase 18-11 [Cordyceps fumosorosea ARSEF 2679]